MLTSYGSENQEYEVGGISDVRYGLRYVFLVDSHSEYVVVAVGLVLARGHRADLAFVIVRLLFLLLGLSWAFKGGAALTSLLLVFSIFFAGGGRTGRGARGGFVIASTGGGRLASNGQVLRGAY